MKRFWTKALWCMPGLFALYCGLLLWLFNTSTQIIYLTNFANGYVFLAYYINAFLLAIGIITFFIRVAEKHENVYFFRWLLISLTIIFLQWLLADQLKKNTIIDFGFKLNLLHSKL